MVVMPSLPLCLIDLTLKQGKACNGNDGARLVTMTAVDVHFAMCLESQKVYEHTMHEEVVTKKLSRTVQYA